MTLQHRLLGLYLDSYDNRYVDLVRVKQEGVLCANKLIIPKDCLRPSIRDNPIYNSISEGLINFFLEVEHHSCNGTYWHFHIPLEAGMKSISKNTDIRTTTIDGMVGDPTIKEGVWLHPELKRIIEKKAPLEEVNMTAEEYVWRFGNPLEPGSYDMVMQGPFTTKYVSKEDEETLFTKTKTCGYVYSNDQEAMEIEVVNQQMAEKLADIERLLPQLTTLDLSKVMLVPDKEAMSRLSKTISKP